MREYNTFYIKNELYFQINLSSLHYSPNYKLFLAQKVLLINIFNEKLTLGYQNWKFDLV